MTLSRRRASEDQPWVVAGSVVVGKTSKDRVYIGKQTTSTSRADTPRPSISRSTRGLEPRLQASARTRSSAAR